ncbi:unnamed protein product [Adineta steineri]|uniref:Uncharacterized protein n=1 Tax=Adineta steineri TaxID=433720 RepID=A0A814K6R1_9BILA|nr:unnamed protein product [Adineta steineri]CAF1048413.1 unnamed protein product [Adineta steineri]
MIADVDASSLDHHPDPHPQIHSILVDFTHPQPVNNDINEIQSTQSTRLRICIRSKVTWTIFAIVIVAIITIPTAIILTKNKNDVETNSTSIMMITTEKESITLMLTTTTTEPSSTIMTAEAGLISLESINGIVYGVYNTKINQNSQASRSGDTVGNYPARESPAQTCDGNPQTKYLSFGRCSGGKHGVECGSDTGFYLELKRGALLVTGLQIYTADDPPERDPITVSLEGSNQSVSNLAFGSSWTLIYNGDSGLKTDPDRYNCGVVQQINNSNRYKSYRFLVSSKRGYENSVQYSELKLFGY